MKEEIGRNDLCPCKSGKKYKRCCMDNIKIIESIPYPTFDEAFLLKDIIDYSVEFKNFYNSERSKIKEKIYWCLDVNLRASARTGAIEIPGFGYKRVIILKQIPLSYRDSFEIAHEIQHTICASEGYPSTGLTEIGSRDPNNMQYASILVNTLADPIVNNDLAQHGFNLWEYYDFISEIQKKGMLNSLSKASDVKQKFYRICFYIQKYFDWELAESINPRGENEFLLWYANKFPQIVEESIDIIAWIKNTGYNTPIQCREIYNGLIKKYEMDSILTVI